jgi:hypothetical protein
MPSRSLLNKVLLPVWCISCYSITALSETLKPNFSFDMLMLTSLHLAKAWVETLSMFCSVRRRDG